MSPTTPIFGWQNRDAAAHDILQLVYHAPPSISSLAARLLKAFRSTAILPQLIELALDELRPHWHRVYALRAIAAAPGDVPMREFEPLVRYALKQCEQRRPEDQITQRHDYLHEMVAIVDGHPNNRTWFFAMLDTASPTVQFGFLNNSLSIFDSEDLYALMLARLLSLLDHHPDLLKLTIVAKLLSDGRGAQPWLDDHYSRILAMCLQQQDSAKLKSMALRWPRLNDALSQAIVGWDEAIQKIISASCPRSEKITYRLSTVYLHLIKQYEQALSGDRNAFEQLARIAVKHGGNIPMRAAATYLIGQLGQQYDGRDILARLVRYGHLEWDQKRFDAPIRYEAGAALLQYPT
ncbi:MAG: hypothetical protein JNJ61_04625, partial [Anaerolineae bacterium]|nr:hypothetical protein [Anaerolineae bacterium]